jgi:hypothetical protein
MMRDTADSEVNAAFSRRTSARASLRERIRRTGGVTRWQLRRNLHQRARILGSRGAPGSNLRYKTEAVAQVFENVRDGPRRAPRGALRLPSEDLGCQRLITAAVRGDLTLILDLEGPQNGAQPVHVALGHPLRQAHMHHPAG